jgi:Icc-related predicted phosphoesterase
MKLLLFSDLHCDAVATRRLVERADAYDVLVGAGDFARVRRGIHICIDILRAVAKPAVVVPGNNETVDELREACRHWPQAHVLHGTGVTISGVPFYGLGGGVPVTPFGSWSFDLTEEQGAELLLSCPMSSVLVSHSPPKGILDRSSGGDSFGSVAVAEAIQRTRPILVVCGHIHECGGQVASLGTTPVVNAGPGGIDWTLLAENEPNHRPNVARR